MAGQGAVQIKFVTKSGTNTWTGTAYEYLRHDALNANTWFRNRDLPPDPETGKGPKDKLRQYQHGFAQGGPILKNKAFFFFNYEEERRPSASTLQRVILGPRTRALTSLMLIAAIGSSQVMAAQAQSDPSQLVELGDHVLGIGKGDLEGWIAAQAGPFRGDAVFGAGPLVLQDHAGI